MKKLERRGRRIGLLGGSFNPAHEGHLHISRLALRRLRLDQVWWLVSPQNPLKPEDGMAAFAERFASARRVARGDRRITVSDAERRLGTRFTADTLAVLTRRYRRHRFVWIMGADNLVQIPRWQRWTSIFHSVPVAVFARPSYSFRALSAKAARRFRRHRVAARNAGRLAGMTPPAWVFLWTRTHAQSATRIRGGAAGG